MKYMAIMFRLTSSVLCLVLIFLAMMDSSYADEVIVIDGHKQMAAGENVAPLQKELLVAETKMVLRGRKMMMDGDSRKMVYEKEEELKGEKEASKTSGNDAYKRTTTKLEAHLLEQRPESQEQAHNDESQRLFDRAADEIVNLMGKDYNKGPVKPRRKSPIHN